MPEQGPVGMIWFPLSYEEGGETRRLSVSAHAVFARLLAFWQHPDSLPEFDGRRFCFYTNEAARRDLGLGRDQCIAAFRELQDRGFIRVEYHGMPRRRYMVVNDEIARLGGVFPVVGKSDFKGSENPTSSSRKTQPQEVGKSDSMDSDNPTPSSRKTRPHALDRSKEIPEGEEIEGEGASAPRNASPSSPRPKGSRMGTPPTLPEVEAYLREYAAGHPRPGIAGLDPEGYARAFVDYYAATEWHDARGQPVRSWKGRLLSWLNRDEQAGRLGARAGNGVYKANDTRHMSAREISGMVDAWLASNGGGAFPANDGPSGVDCLLGHDAAKVEG